MTSELTADELDVAAAPETVGDSEDPTVGVAPVDDAGLDDPANLFPQGAVPEGADPKNYCANCRHEHLKHELPYGPCSECAEDPRTKDDLMVCGAFTPSA